MTGQARTGRQQRLAPLAARQVVGRSPVLKEPKLVGSRLFWLEQRPSEQGRTTLLMRPGVGEPPIELTPNPADLRSRVHAYGGGVYAVEGDTLVYLDDRDRCLWSLELPATTAAASEPAALPAAQPRRLCEPADPGPPRAFADGLIDPRLGRWIGVMEQDGRDQLVAVPLAGGEPQLLHAPADFCGYAVLAPGGRQLAWVEWQQPYMPWERSQLWLGQLDDDGRLRQARVIAGSGGGDAVGVSVFQPLWAGADLVVANDHSGWWNLERLEAAETLAPEDQATWQPLLPMAAEFALPQWVYGLRTTAWDGRQLVAAACREGRWELGRLEPEGQRLRWQPLAVPFEDLAGLDAHHGRVVAIAASATEGPGLLELSLGDGTEPLHWRHTPASPAPLPATWPAEAISRPQQLAFSGHGDQPAHAWFYPPAGGAHPQAPLLVKGHSGPTGMARTGLSPAIQFWTSRGWGVVDVNYGGSTGFGRAYRERLDGQWGVVDVADCTAAARAVVAAGWASAERIAMEGGSAAGFTVLEALASGDTIRAGACRYPVTDLTALAQGEHRFEARYCDTLVGPWPAAAATYQARSPMQHVERLHAPVILFHGLDDRVVPPEQSERLALALGEHGVPVQLHLLPGEGHGFRSQEVQQRVLEATEAFFRHHFNLQEPSA